jgi:hypothetical protein
MIPGGARRVHATKTKWKSDQSQDSSEEQGRSKDLPPEEELFWAPYLSITTISEEHQTEEEVTGLWVV